MNVLVVYCHPDPASFTHAVLQRALVALDGAGHDVRLIDLYAESFEPALSAADRADHLVAFDERTSPDPVVARHVADLRWCTAIVLVYPTWWSGQPAMLKGWFDRVWVRGVAWDLAGSRFTRRRNPGDARLRRQLVNVRRLVAITTHGSSKWINVVQGEGGKRVMTRSLRAMCHPLARTRWVALYGIDAATAEVRDRFLARLENRLSRLR